MAKIAPAPEPPMSPRAGAAARTVAQAQPDFPSWAPVAGLTSGLLTLAFLMMVAILLMFIRGHDLPPQLGFVVPAILSLGVALAFSFLGGTAAAEGKLPIPFAKTRPVAFSVTGGIATFVVVLLLGLGGWRSAVPAASDPTPGDVKTAVSSTLRTDAKLATGSPLKIDASPAVSNSPQGDRGAAAYAAGPVANNQDSVRRRALPAVPSHPTAKASNPVPPPPANCHDVYNTYMEDGRVKGRTVQVCDNQDQTAAQ